MTQESKTLYSTRGDVSLTMRGFHTFMRFGLTVLYFGFLLPFINELVLSIVSWAGAGVFPSFNHLFEAGFLAVWASIKFGMPAVLMGCVFALLVTIFKSKVWACVITPVFGVGTTYLYLSRYIYVEDGVRYFLSTSMQHVSVIDAGVLGLLLSVLACTVLKPIFMPAKQAQMLKSEKALSKTKQPESMGNNSSVKRKQDKGTMGSRSGIEPKLQAV